MRKCSGCSRKIGKTNQTGLCRDCCKSTGYSTTWSPRPSLRRFVLPANCQLLPAGLDARLRRYPGEHNGLSVQTDDLRTNRGRIVIKRGEWLGPNEVCFVLR